MLLLLPCWDCRAGDVCALLRPGLAHTARLGLGLALCALGWARAVGTWLQGRAGAPAAARWLPAPGAASPRSRIPLCPSAGTAGLGLPRPVLPRALGQGGDPGDSDSSATLGGVKLGTVLVRGVGASHRCHQERCSLLLPLSQHSAVSCGTPSWHGWAGGQGVHRPDPVPVPAQLCL